ncbi:hypothetical protein [Streptomyces sp. S186]|uniref:hypothetical protein n=1 Tax=Streptomyces sp. S186 TaxID=3434395 RepID=UPI003F675C73
MAADHQLSGSDGTALPHLPAAGTPRRLALSVPCTGRTTHGATGPQHQGRMAPVRPSGLCAGQHEWRRMGRWGAAVEYRIAPRPSGPRPYTR